MRALGLTLLLLAAVVSAQPTDCGPAWNGCGPAGGVTPTTTPTTTSSTTSTTSTTTSSTTTTT